MKNLNYVSEPLSAYIVTDCDSHSVSVNQKILFHLLKIIQLNLEP